MTAAGEARSALSDAHRREWPRVVAATVRVARDLDLAEECVQDAYADALERWTRDGVPDNPAAWLTTAARRRAIDSVRRESVLRGKLPLLIERDVADPEEPQAEATEEAAVRDDLLRLVLLCCHPALPQEGRIALTLRLVCGVATVDIARLFLVPEATAAARITRAKRKIAGSGIAFRLPVEDLAERMEHALEVVHLLFTAGHTAPTGATLLRPGLLETALHLARLLHDALPTDPEAAGLLALLLATDARRDARTDADGALVRLADQDRTRFDRDAIARARTLVMQALPHPAAGRFCLQAAIAVLHAEPEHAEDTDFVQILALYDQLLHAWPSPVVRLNRAVALAQVHGPRVALAELEDLEAHPGFADHHLLHAVLAEVLARLDRPAEAADHLERAIARTPNEIEAAHLQHRLRRLREPATFADRR